MYKRQVRDGLKPVHRRILYAMYEDGLTPDKPFKLSLIHIYSIIKEISRYFRLEEDQIRGQSRSRDCVNARQIAMYLIRRMTSNSLSDTGLEFSGRDHTTVLHSIEQVEKKMKKDPAFAETVKAIITNINSKK